MGNEYGGYALIAQPLDQVKECLGLGGRENGRRFIKEEKASVGYEGLEHLEPLLESGGECFHTRAKGEWQPRPPHEREEACSKRGG
jgi:hypothetical protein